MFFHVIFIMILKTVSVFCLQKLTKDRTNNGLKPSQTADHSFITIIKAMFNSSFFKDITAADLQASSANSGSAEVNKRAQKKVTSRKKAAAPNPASGVKVNLQPGNGRPVCPISDNQEGTLPSADLRPLKLCC